MAGPRVTNVAGFTPTRHSTVPDFLEPSKAKLPKGYTACVIGASAGIGEHIAYALATAGASTLILAARNPSKLQPVADHITSTLSPTTKVYLQTCDVSSPDSVKALATYIHDNIISQPDGRLDAVIPNAGYAPPIVGMQVTQNSPEEIRKAMDTNFVGTYSVAHHFIPLLQQSMRGGKSGKGQLIVIGSFAALLTKGIIANTGYTISKFAQTRLVEYVDEQFGPGARNIEKHAGEKPEERKSILAVALHPGAVQTDMAEGNTPEQFRKYLVDDVRLCGAWVTWLCSRERTEVDWMGGRLVSALWDVEELMAKKDEVVKGDLLKFELAVR